MYKKGASYRSFRASTKKTDHLVEERSGLLTSRGIKFVTALVQRVFAKRIVWPAHLIFDDVANTAILSALRVSEFPMLRSLTKRFLDQELLEALLLSPPDLDWFP